MVPETVCNLRPRPSAPRTARPPKRRGAPSHVCRSRIACVTLSSLEDGSIHSLNEIKRAWPRKTRKIVARCHVPADSCKRTRNLKTILSDPFMSRCKIWELTLHVTKLALAFRREAIFSNEPRKNAAEGGRGEGRVLRFLRCRAHTIRPKRSNGGTERTTERRTDAAATQVQIHGRVSNKRVEGKERARARAAKAANIILFQRHSNWGRNGLHERD